MARSTWPRPSRRRIARSGPPLKSLDLRPANWRGVSIQPRTPLYGFIKSAPSQQASHYIWRSIQMIPRVATTGGTSVGAFGSERSHRARSRSTDVDVQIQRSAETLNDRHGPAESTGYSRLPGATPQQPKHRPHEDPRDCAAQRVVPRQHVPQTMGQAQHPLAHGHDWKDVINAARRRVSSACRWRRHPSRSTDPRT